MSVQLFILLALVTSACLTGLDQEAPGPLHVSAMQALADRNYSRAETLLKDLLAEHPRDGRYLEHLADVQQELGRTDQALQTLATLLDIQPQHESAAMKSAGIMVERGDWEAVIRVLRPLSIASQSYELVHTLADAYHRLDRPIEASWYFDRAVRLNSAAVEDCTKLAELHLARDLPALAVRALQSALPFAGDEPQLHYLLAKAFHQAGRPLGKVQIMPIPQAIPGNISGRWYVLEAVEDHPGRYRVCPSDSAIYHLHRALDLGLEQADVHLLLADIWFSANLYTRARDIYETIESAVPQLRLAEYHYRYGMTLYWQDDLQGFLKHIELAGGIDPEHYKHKLLEAHTLLAERYCIRGDLERYIHHLELAVNEAPRTTELRYKLGNALNEAGRRGEAASHWQVVLQLQPYHEDRQRLLRLLNYADVELGENPGSE